MMDCRSSGVGNWTAQAHGAQEHVHGDPERIDEPLHSRSVAVLVPHPTREAVIDRHCHLVLVGSAWLDGGRFNNADFAGRNARRIVIRLVNLGRALAKRKHIRGRVRRIVADDLAEPHAGLVLGDVEIAVHHEALPRIAVEHRGHDIAETVRIGDHGRSGEPSERARRPKCQANRNSRIRRGRRPSARWP